ncbi:MAG: efflux RND transporter permease subunit, partial [Oscillospiraceae bacterium]
MQHLTKTALSRPVSTLIVILALLVFGLSAVLTTPLELTPNIEMPMLIVMTTYPGAGPEDVESLVTRKIEDAVATLGGVKNVQSMSSENVSMVILEMEYGTDMAVAHADLKNNIDIYNDALPEDASTPTVMELNINTMMPTMLLSATPLGDVDLRYYVEEEIVPEFEKLSGVAKVDVFGGAQDYISIELQEDKLSQYALTMDSVASILASADFSLPAGSIGQGELDLPLRGGVTYDSVEQVGALALMLPTGDVIHLSDVAKVYQNTEKSDSLSRYNGVENVGIQITKRQGASTVSVANAVEKAMNQLNAGAMGVQLQVAYDASTMIRVAISSVVQTLVGGVILAMAVLFLFFGDWRASLVVGASIPLSMLATVIAMKAMGFSYNILSLGGLVIGCGMMVDNSIVVLESCFRCKGGGRSFHETSIEGARVVASSVMASTITTVVVFLPIAFIQGMSGQLFGQLCFTIVFSLLASLLSAVTLVPLAFYALAPKEREYQFVKRAMAKIEGAYANVLPRTLRHKGRVVLVAIALLVISLAIVPLIGIEMLPLTDDGIVELSVTARPGLKLERLNELLLPLEQMINEHPDVDRYSLSTGG